MIAVIVDAVCLPKTYCSIYRIAAPLIQGLAFQAESVHTGETHPEFQTGDTHWGLGAAVAKTISAKAKTQEIYQTKKKKIINFLVFQIKKIKIYLVI